jgi:hypothetical protein
MGHKIDNFSLMIWILKSPRQFLSLCLKTKRTSVHWLLHKTDGGREAWDTHRDLAACFSWKEVTLGFLSLASRLADARLQVVHVTSSRRSRGVEAEDGRVDATSCIGL